jgi:hypothetical protein
VLAWHELADGRRFEVFGRYDDVVVRRGDRFLIRSRRFRTYGASDLGFRFARVDRGRPGSIEPLASDATGRVHHRIAGGALGSGTV